MQMLKLNAPLFRSSAIFLALVGAVLIAAIGCGGGGGGGSSTAGVTGSTAGVLPDNVIVFGQPNGTGNDFAIYDISPTGGSPTTVAADVSGSILLYVQNPNKANSYVLAAIPSGGSNYGIYLATGPTLTGATQLVAPVYSDVSSLAITQDSSHIVYSATNAAGVSYLFTLPTSGGTPANLGLSDGSTISPANNNTIAYVAPPNASGGNDQVYTRSLSAGAAGSATQITTDDVMHTLPAFSRDGTQLAYWEESGTSLLKIDLLATGVVTTLTNPSGDTPLGEAFSSDGSQIAIAGDLNFQGQLEVQATNGTSEPDVIFTAGVDVGLYGVYWTGSNGRGIARAGSTSAMRRPARLAIKTSALRKP
jgi:hypothetical protein